MGTNNRIDFEGIARSALSRIDELLQKWLPGGSKSNSEYSVVNPLRSSDDDEGSFLINLKSGAWSDFAAPGVQGGDLISLYAYRYGVKNSEAALAVAEQIGFSPNEVGKKQKQPAKPKKGDIWQPILPVPNDAPTPPAQHYQLGRPDKIIPYFDVKNQPIGFIWRFENVKNKSGKLGKEFRPLTFCKNVKTGETRWFHKSWKTPRPLYGLEHINHNSSRTIVIAEGEKCVDALRQLLPEQGYIALSAGNGVNSVKMFDFSPLAGRKVILWPDNDEAGKLYALSVAGVLIKQDGENSVVSIATPPHDAPAKWDAADALEQGWTTDQAVGLLQMARSAFEIIREKSAEERAVEKETKTEGKPKKEKKAKRKFSSELIELARRCEFWHDNNKNAYATVEITRGDQTFAENYRIESQDFKDWLSLLWYVEKGSPVGRDHYSEAIGVIRAEALLYGKKHEIFIRVGQIGRADEIWVDLCDDNRQVVKIDKHGWEVQNGINCPVKFIRPDDVEALAYPIGGEILEDHLPNLFHFDDVQLYKLMVGWILSCYRVTGAKPILSLTGRPGSAKTSLFRLLVRLTHPTIAAEAGPPEDHRDFAIIGYHTWVVTMDNVEKIPGWLSADFCRASTGGAYRTRKLHTDMGLIYLKYMRPCIMNGIGGIGGKKDMIRRTIHIDVPKLNSDDYISDEEYEDRVERSAPYIQGALFNIISSGLKNYHQAKVNDKSSMISHLQWITACEPGLGWGEDDLAYQGHFKNHLEGKIGLVMDNEPVAQAIISYIIDEEFKGTMTALLNYLNQHVQSSQKKDRSWPKTAGLMGQCFVRIESDLEDLGYVVEHTKTSSARLVKIIPPPNMDTPEARQQKHTDHFDNEHDESGDM